MVGAACPHVHACVRVSMCTKAHCRALHNRKHAVRAGGRRRIWGEWGQSARRRQLLLALEHTTHSAPEPARCLPGYPSQVRACTAWSSCCPMTTLLRRWCEPGKPQGAWRRATLVCSRWAAAERCAEARGACAEPRAQARGCCTALLAPLVAPECLGSLGSAPAGAASWPVRPLCCHNTRNPLPCCLLPCCLLAFPGSFCSLSVLYLYVVSYAPVCADGWLCDAGLGR